VDAALRRLGAKLREAHERGLAGLLTEDTVRWFLIEELIAGGTPPSDLRTEVRVEHDRGRLDLVRRGPAGDAALEFKFPRNGAGAADTMSVGEIVNDLIRLSRLTDYEACWFVAVIDARFMGYLSRRPYWNWPTTPGAELTFTASDLAQMPETARRSAHRSEGFEALSATTVVAEPVGFATLLTLRVHSGMGSNAGASQGRYDTTLALNGVTVPQSGATVDEIAKFALSYPGYRLHGDVPTIGAISRRVAEGWRAGELTSDLDDLRAALFFVQRADHWTDHFDEPFARALIEQIRRVSGGTVDGSDGITV